MDTRGFDRRIIHLSILLNPDSVELVCFGIKYSGDIENKILAKAPYYHFDSDCSGLFRVCTSRHSIEKYLHPMGEGNNQAELYFE